MWLEKWFMVITFEDFISILSLEDWSSLCGTFTDIGPHFALKTDPHFVGLHRYWSSLCFQGLSLCGTFTDIGPHVAGV